jgi:hypothetical protein
LRAIGILSLLALAACCSAQTVTIPGNPLTIPAINAGGVSTTLSGSLTAASTISLSVSGTGCLQGGGAYCTNAAGIVVVAGSSAIGAATSFSGTIGVTATTWTYGVLTMTINGIATVPLFQANAANGLGSGSPPTTLTLNNVSLAALGFPSNLNVTNPTVTFVIADSNYPDNSNSMTASGSFTTAATAVSAPALSDAGLATLALLLLAAAVVLLRRRDADAR